jgi:hypothetical protein
LAQPHGKILWVPQSDAGVADLPDQLRAEPARAKHRTTSRLSRLLRAPWTASVLVIVVGSAFIAWRLQSGFFIWNDDLLQFKMASEQGLSWELLSLNLFQHFAPVNRLLHLIALELFDLDPAGMAWISAVLAAGLLCTVAWLATELGLSPLRRTFALVLMAGSIVLADTLSWMDGGWHGVTALIATYLVVAMHVRARRTDDLRWHLLSVLFFVLGLLTQERAAFALPMVVLVDLFLLDRLEPFRARVGKLLAVKWPLITMAVAAAALAVLLKLEYVTEGGTQPQLALVGRTTLAALTNQLFPQLVGFVPPSWPLIVQLAVLFLLGAATFWLCRKDRRNFGPIVFFCGSFVLYWGFLVVSPILNETNWIEQSQRYALYTLVPLALTLSSLRIGPGPRWWADLTPGSRRRTSAVAVLTTAGVLFATQWLYTVGPRWDPNRESHNYLRNIADSAPSWSNPAVTVVPTQAPRTVAVDWATSLGRGEFLLPLVSPGRRTADLTDTVVSFDNEGNLQPTALQVLARGRPVSPPLYPGSTTTDGITSCLAPSNGDDGLRFTLDRPVDVAPALIRLTFSSTTPDELNVVTLNSTSYRWTDWPQPVAEGVHTVLLPTSTESLHPADGVQLSKLSAGTTFCVRSLDVVAPVVLRPDGGCSSMDQYGTPVTAVACPSD